MSTASAPAIELVDVSASATARVRAVNGINLAIEPGEFIALLGPSGCGKSTLLKLIAGLEDLSDGEIYIGGRLANYLHPSARDVAMVFQNYALYPHMTVRTNLGFPLKMSGVAREAISAKVETAASLLQLTDQLDRYPDELSGGQRQRVALGRAIVREPLAFLMDEPLSNLDALLRVEMRSELVRLHKRVGRTTIYVTHDQVEAMTMADWLVVMRNGVVEQIGRPDDVYSRPANSYVATFVGARSMNLFDGRVVTTDGARRVRRPVSRSRSHRTRSQAYRTARSPWSVRPEDVSLCADPGTPGAGVRCRRARRAHRVGRLSQRPVERGEHDRPVHRCVEQDP